MMITTLMMLTGLAQAIKPIAPPKPSAEQMALYQAMKVRDPAPSCEGLVPLSTTLDTDLIWLVDHVQQPPWVGIRAAQCVVSHHADVQADTIEAWMTDPSKMGVAILTLRLLDTLPEPTAIRFATAALAGPLSEKATLRLADSVHPGIKAMVADSEPAPTPQAE
jgi:hypothetical protein